MKFKAVFFASLLLIAQLFVISDQDRVYAQRLKDVGLTTKEEAWLKVHPKIRVGVDPAYPPFEYIGKNNAYQGLASDYIKIISDHLGIQLEVLPDLSWSQVIEGVKNKTIDMLPVVARDWERSEFLNFTSPYITFPAVILTREDYPFISTLRDFKGKTIVMVKNYYYNQQIVKKIPSARIFEVETPLAALKALSTGKANGYVGNLAVTDVLMRKHGIVNLKVAAPADIDNPGFSMGVRKDWPELAGILNKALASISEKEKYQISEKWISLSGQKIVDYTLVRRISAAAAAIILIILFWNVQIRRQKNVLQRKEEELRKLNRIIASQKQRMEGELNIGRKIQMSMVPSTFPPFPKRSEISIFAMLLPAHEVGGDFYDFLFIDESRLCFCIGDVSGKGVPAALLMAVTKTLIKSRAVDDFSTASIITHVNDELFTTNEECMFATIFAGILNVKTGELTYTNAGHNPPYLIKQNGSLKRMGKLHGPIVGCYEGEIFKQDKITLLKGDMLFLYTDGITEARNREKKFYSEERLAELLLALKGQPVEEFVKATVSEVERFVEGAKQADDITALSVQFLGQPETPEPRKLEISLKNQLIEMKRFKNRFNTFAEECRIPTTVHREMNIVFDELLSNIIFYAFRDDEEYTIEITVNFSEDRLVAIITDDGIPFNPFEKETAEIERLAEKQKVGGLGIHIVRNLMDDLTYNRRAGKNHVTLVKKLETDSNI